MAVIDQRIIVVAGGALPGQNDGVIIALFAVVERVVGMDGGTVGYTDGIIGKTCVEAAVFICSRPALVMSTVIWRSSSL